MIRKIGLKKHDVHVCDNNVYNTLLRILGYRRQLLKSILDNSLHYNITGNYLTITIIFDTRRRFAKLTFIIRYKIHVNAWYHEC